ncbi:MAG: tryptophan--tRNA ligase [Desulfobacca sp. 4484_104]|nr:MAG: tryptophan--tRNA ligase [Desulfobacca sp. 4484_104]RLA88568.1 MAG: tryptophan--tRNA ligase [Deltaproteobacteria bacterium]
MAKKRILSGMRPTGKLHLGNLHGALENWVRLQDEYECYYFVADWHALTTDYEQTEGIRDNVWEMVIDWLSVGLDPQKSTLFVQSAIKEHAELFMLFSMITPIAWLERNPTYKEQIQEMSQKDLHMFGFLGYPVLQAADILMYKAHGVPVGVDQLPHVELTREIARRFNHLYGVVFPEPATILTEVPKLLGIDGRKMSKSYHNCIYLSDPPEVIRRQVSLMVTDTMRPRKKDPGDPDRCLAFPYHRLYLPPETLDRITAECRSATLGCVECKKILAEALVEYLAPIRQRRRDYLEHPKKVQAIIEDGNARARTQAQQTMAEVREAVKI